MAIREALAPAAVRTIRKRNLELIRWPRITKPFTEVLAAGKLAPTVLRRNRPVPGGIQPTRESVTIHLYSQKINPFAEKVAGALALKGVDFLRVTLDDPDEIKRISPETQLLPVLEDGGERIWDSASILDWIEEKYPEPKLYSSDTKIAEAQHSLAEWSDSSFAWYWNRWRMASQISTAEQSESSDGLLSRIHGRIERSIGRSSQNGNSIHSRELEIMDEVANRMNDLVGLLGDRDFFYADQPSVADLSVYGMLCILWKGPMPGSSTLVDHRPALAAYAKRMASIIPPA